MNSTAPLFPVRSLPPTILAGQMAATESVAASSPGQQSAAERHHAATSASSFDNGLRARWSRMVNTKKVIHPPALRFSEVWAEAAEAICRSWVDDQSMHDQSRVSHVALSKMKALEYERKHREQIAPERRLLPLAGGKKDYYDAEVDAFLEAIGERDARAVLESFKLAGTGGLHRQNTTLTASITNAIGAAQLLVPEPVTKAGLAGARLLMQGVMSASVVQAGTRRLRNAGTEDILPLGRADAAPAAKIAPNMLQASSRAMNGLRGAHKNLQNMQAAMHDLELLQSAFSPDPEALQAAKRKLELTFAKLCHQLSLKSSYKTSSESAKVEFRGNQRYLLTSYAGTSTNLAVGLIAIMTPVLIAAPITGGLSAAAVALALGLYLGYQLSTGPAKDGEAKAKRAIVALVKLVNVLSGEQSSDIQRRAQAWQTYLDARRPARFASPVKRKDAKRAAEVALLDELEKITSDDQPEQGLTMQRNWAAYREWCDARDAIAASSANGVIDESQCRQGIMALEEQFRRDHTADFALNNIVAAWKTPMLIRMVAAQRTLKGRVARLQAKLIAPQNVQLRKACWGLPAQKEKVRKKNESHKIKLRQTLCDLFNLELALQDLARPTGIRPEEKDILRASRRIAAIHDEDVHALFCGDSRAQVDAVDTSKRLTAGEAQRYTYINAGAAALGLTVNIGVSIADLTILQEKAAGTYGGPHYNDYKFFTLSQGQAQPAAHLAVGDRAAFQHREMRPLLECIDHIETQREICLQLDGGRNRVLHLQDGDVETALNELVDQLASSGAVPQTLNFSLGAPPTVTSEATASPAAKDHTDQPSSVPHGVVVELMSTTAYHNAQLKQNSLQKKIGFRAELLAVAGRQALMSIAGLPTQAIAQYQLKKTRAPLTTAADTCHDVRALLQSVAVPRRAKTLCPPTDNPPRIAQIQRVFTDNAEPSRLLWERLQKAEETRWSGVTPPGYFVAAAVPPNTTGVRCRDNDQVLKVQDRPIHCHRIGPPQASANTALAQMPSTYAAGQSPDAHCLDDFLLQGIASRQGIFQFVSRRAQYAPERSTETPIIAMLKQRRRDHPTALLGDRYRIDDFLQVEQKESDSPSDHLHFMLHVTDLGSNQTPPAVLRIPITQAGLKFTDRVLDAEHIARASALMEAHIDQLPTAVDADANDAPARSGIDRMILSRAGIGRNATLISYRTLLAQIANADRRSALTEATLDDALFDVIYTGRGDRDAAYIPSLPQLTALRQALLLRIIEQRSATAVPQSTHLQAVPSQG